MKVLLAYRCQPGGRRDFYTRQMPVGLGTLNAVLRVAGHDARLANFSRSTWREVRRTLRNFRPRMVGVSLFTFNRRAALKLARVVKEVDRRIFVVAGGPHATHLAETVLARHPAVDAIVTGEGEETLRDLVDAFDRAESLEGIPGLVLRGAGGPFRTASRPPVPSLDSLPQIPLHYESYHVDRYAQLEFLISSRGCPARCTFCSTPEFWGTRLRYRGVEHVLSELRLLQERFGHVTVSFRDDTFTVDKGRTIELCRRIIDSGLHLMWDCQSRVNAIDEERLVWMRRAGCQHIQYGVESGSPSVLRRLNKGILVEQVLRAGELTRRVGMDLSIYLITGTEGETAADVRATLRLIRRLRPHDGIVSPLVVYPGTALYQEAREARGLDDSIWDRSSMEGLLVREDPESILAYRQVDATLREIAATAVYTPAEREAHLGLVGEYPAPLLSAGETWESGGEPERAEAAYRRMLDRCPGSLWGHLRLGNILETTRRTPEAVAHYRAAVAAVPRYHLARSLLGSALRRLGSRAEAAREFRRALALYPGDRVALRGLQLLKRGPGRPRRLPPRPRRPSSALTASPTWPAFLQHPIPDGQPFRADGDAEPR